LPAAPRRPSSADLRQDDAPIVKSSFRDQGIVKVRAGHGRNQQGLQRGRRGGQAAGRKDVAKAIEAANLKTIKWPSDGKFLGDWKKARSWPRAAAA
jgi:sulfur-oxidizing protein SoxX